MPNPATPQDVANRWRPLTAVQTTNAATFLADAWRELRRRVPEIETRLTAATDDDLRDEVVKVLANAVLRVLKNPDGSARESADDASWTPNQAVASGLLYLTDDDLLPITQPVAPGALSGAYVISLGG
jgi:hypothetical protein